MKMGLVSRGITVVAEVLATIVGGLIALGIVVALVTQSVPTGAKASLSIAHYGVVMGGAIMSYADNIGPDLAEGKAIGDKALKGSTN